MKNTLFSGLNQEAGVSRDLQTAVTPIAPCVLVHGDNGGYRWMVVQCPICLARGRHFHGAGGPGADPRKSLGHRVAHCCSPISPERAFRGYELVDIASGSRAGGRTVADVM
jgi:hypothetical protein